MNAAELERIMIDPKYFNLANVEFEPHLIQKVAWNLMAVGVRD